MFWDILKKETLTGILDYRFSIGTLLCIILMSVSIFLSGRDFQNRVRIYNERIGLQMEAQKTYANLNDSNPLVVAFKPPMILSTIAKGFDISTERDSIYVNSVNILYQNFDPMFLISVIYSLMAILFSYDIISREKEGKTFSLLLSNPLTRSILVMSKWFGGILLILVILSLPFLIGLLIFIFDSRISLSNNDLIAILLILSFSFIYLAIFYSIGVLVSTATLDSSRSLLISIFIWLFFILLVPNFGHYLAEYLFKIPSRDIIEHNLAQIEKERQDEIQKAIKPYILSQNISEAEALKIAGIEEINKKYNEKSQKIYSNYKSKVKALTRIVRAINIISPTSCFIYSLTEISHTGQEAKEDFERQKEEYLRIYRNYVLKKYREELEKNPKFSVMDKLDLSEIPTFAFKERTLSERLSTIYIYILSMLFWLFLFLILSIFIIQRSDVR